MTKRALITGITGQDGSHLAEFLLGKGYDVHGIKRRASSFNTDRIDHLSQDVHERDTRFFLHYGDLTDAANLMRIIQHVRLDEIYNLAAQSHVAVSFEVREYTANSNAPVTLRILEAIRALGLEKTIKFYQASFVLRKWKLCWVTQPRRIPGWAGGQRWDLTSWSAKW